MKLKVVISVLVKKSRVGWHLQGEILNHKDGEDEAYNTNKGGRHNIPTPLTLPI